jgi:acylglycerol lipase
VFAVLADVKMQDAALAKKNATVAESRKVFVAGQSLGGFVAVLTCLFVLICSYHLHADA